MKFDRLVLATHNAKKLTELQRVLSEAGLDITVLGLGDIPSYPEPVEDGTTFADNALIKARAAVRHGGLPALADDSGLSVDVLNGMPGVRSARWAGADKDDEANLRLVLAQIDDVPDERRTARFVCEVALVMPDLAADPSGQTTASEFCQHGEVEGLIVREPRGENGFGYDPIFQPLGEDRTTAQMDPQEKDAISHRGQALRAMVSVIDGLRRHPDPRDPDELDDPVNPRQVPGGPAAPAAR